MSDYQRVLTALTEISKNQLDLQLTQSKQPKLFLITNGGVSNVAKTTSDVIMWNESDIFRNDIVGLVYDASTGHITLPSDDGYYYRIKLSSFIKRGASHGTATAGSVRITLQTPSTNDSSSFVNWDELDVGYVPTSTHTTMRGSWTIGDPLYVEVVNDIVASNTGAATFGQVELLIEQYSI
uniref:Uncharacterized protein n=1 Tax=viral metagenome TaxID=1070528 RepID=A0A2V0RIT3_9ZZZZ